MEQSVAITEKTETATGASGAAREAGAYERPRGKELRRALWRVNVAWIFGSAWMTATAAAGTPFTNYAKVLKASDLQFGLLSAAPFLAAMLSMAASLLIEGTGKRKRIFLWGLYFQRWMWLPIAVLPVLLVQIYGQDGIAPAMTLFLTLVLFMHMGQAVGSPAWTSWMADIVPEPVWGSYFSRRKQWGLVSAVPVALLVGWLIDFVAVGQGPMVMLYLCAGIFIAAMACGVTDISLFHGVPDVPKAPRKGAHLLAAWREPLHNPAFLWFAGFVGVSQFALTLMGQFVTLHIMKQMAGDGQGAWMNLVTQTMVVVVPAVAQLMVFSLWGRTADRMGKRPLLKMAGLGLVPVGLGWCFVTRETFWLGYALSAAGAALWAGIDVANSNIVLEFSGSSSNSDNRPVGSTSYVAVNSAIVNVSGLLGGVTAGLIAQALSNWRWEFGAFALGSYGVLFLLSTALRLAAVMIFIPHIKEPTAKPARVALRFMVAHTYDNLTDAAMQPLRLLGLGRRGSRED
jgi:MFS family permease